MKTYKFIIGIGLSIGLAGALPASAQWVNNGAAVFIAANTDVMVNNADYVHQSGDVELNGWLGVGGNWENNDANSFALNSDGKGTVELLGDAQTIGGSNHTAFYNLLLSGTGVKTLGVEQEVSNELNLTDRELALQDFKLSVTATNLGAIQRSSGFISTESSQGTLVRKTALTGEYLFPMGSGRGITRYRPVMLQVPDAEASFAVSFTNDDANKAGFSRDNLSAGVTNVNPDYYHRIERVNGITSFDVSILYNVSDGGFQEMTYWDNTGSSWKNLQKTSLVTGVYGDNLDRKITKTSVDLLTSSYYALSNGVLGNNILSIPTAFSPNGDGRNDVLTIIGIDNYPDNEVSILNRWGDILFTKKSYSSSNTFDGGDLNPGTYYYVVKLKVNSETKMFSGYITLLR